jgi:hypothetical protein
MGIDDIKQIKPANTPINEETVPEEVEEKPKEESILIPKINQTIQKDVEKQEAERPLGKEPDKKEDPKEAAKKLLNPMTPEKAERKKKLVKVAKIAGIVLAVVFILIVIPSIFVYKNGTRFYSATQKLVAAAKEQNLDLVKTELENTKKAQSSFKKSYALISWTRFIPFVGGYVSDGRHAINAAGYGLNAASILIDTAEPYADILGFSGANVLGEASDGEKTAQERIDFIVKTLPDLTPKIDTLSAEIGKAKEELDQIKPSRYPVSLAGKPVREKIKQAVEIADTADRFIKDGKPLLEQAPYLLGLDEKRTYFVLFQNDKELRPTGGFMTAYSIMEVDKARFEPVVSNDIYTLDAEYKPRTDAPEPIITYLKGPYILNQNLRLRDMNWSPDFAESMDLFTKEAERVGIEDIDGVIAVDTQLLVYLLDAIGPIGVPGFGNFSTEIIADCNCPQVIFELESFADVEGPIVWDPNTGEIVYRPPNSDNRKAIIGPLMNSIMANALGSPKEKVAKLFEAGFKSLIEKHVLFYLFDDDAQNAVESFHIAGKVENYEGDYLLINDANLGGRKSNLYVTEEISQEVAIAKDGSVQKTVTITYKNPEAYDGWLNSVLPNWVRIYVPKGSELISIDGLQDKEDPYEELGKTVFAGFFELRPQGVSKVEIVYKLPFKVADDYRLLMQKQPGKDKPLYSISVGKKTDEFFLKEDKEFIVRDAR